VKPGGQPSLIGNLGLDELRQERERLLLCLRLQRPRMGGYVTLTGPKEGRPPPEGASVAYAPGAEREGRRARPALFDPVVEQVRSAARAALAPTGSDLEALLIKIHRESAENQAKARRNEDETRRELDKRLKGQGPVNLRGRTSLTVRGGRRMDQVLQQRAESVRVGRAANAKRQRPDAVTHGGRPDRIPLDARTGVDDPRRRDTIERVAVGVHLVNARGQEFDAATIARAADTAAGEVEPMDDLQGTAEYRRDMLRVWVRCVVAGLADGRTS
jgi:hypothetical protein